MLRTRQPTRFAAAAIALVALTGAATAGFAHKSEVDTSLWRKRLKPATTSSTAWADVPGLAAQAICAVDGLSASASLDLQGAHEGVEVRLVTGDSGTGDSTPARPTFTVDTGDSATDRDTETVVLAADVPRGATEVGLQWRSVAGAEVTLHGGTLVLSYRELDGCA